jgi:cell shape-determining protein MreC
VQLHKVLAQRIKAMTKESDVVRENERLREALKPFAAKADYADTLEAEDADYVDCAPFTARNYRDTRAALSTDADEKG